MIDAKSVCENAVRTRSSRTTVLLYELRNHKPQVPGSRGPAIKISFMQYALNPVLRGACRKVRAANTARTTSSCPHKIGHKTTAW